MKGGKGEQLQMFMSSQELKSAVTNSNDVKIGEDLTTMWDRKLQESKDSGGHGSGVYAAMKRDGFQTSKQDWTEMSGIPMVHEDGGGKRIAQGHHRVAALADIERSTGRDQWVPVSHIQDLPKNTYRWTSADEDVM